MPTNINLSKRQYSLLEMFVEGALRLNIPSAQHFDQRPFRSLLVRRWIVYSRNHGGFHVTREGRQAWDEFRHADIQRRDPTGPLTRFFDPTQYGLTDPYLEGRRHRLEVVKSKSSAA